MKKKVIIGSDVIPGWIGGLYYRKNIAFTISQNPYIISNCTIIVLSINGDKQVFSDLPSPIKVVDRKFKTGLFKKIYKYAFIFFRRAIFYCFPNSKSIPGSTYIAWIPDFQHKYYPRYFSNQEINRRDAIYSDISKKDTLLILSSRSAMEDYLKYYKGNIDKSYVVPFVSYIEPEIRRLSDNQENRIISKHGLVNGTYCVIMNQFWQHKNHIVVLEAMKYYFNTNPDNRLIFVFTGELKDDRNPEYINAIKILFDEPIIKEHAALLGYISREEQIAIMKNAAFVIQPSLFEGWGTVVEDSKVLDKTILLSDIPVHREQMNEKCILFDPHDSVALADLIYQESKKEHHDDVEKGIADMYKRAKDYSKGFELLLRDLEKK